MTKQTTIVVIGSLKTVLDYKTGINFHSVILSLDLRGVTSPVSQWNYMYQLCNDKSECSNEGKEL